MNPGEIIAGRFRIDRLAGYGGMGAVFRAIDLANDTPVALKLLIGQNDRTATSRFAREARDLGSLSHPGIARYVAHGETTAGEPYLAMEWLDGETLAARLERRPLEATEALIVALGVAEALGAVHARGLVHRDVKPANLFLVGGDPARVKLLDFGIARSGAGASVLTRDGAMIGTAGYMAVEQARGERDIDARADVFALGCVLFECIARRAAFGGEHPLAWLGQLLTEPPPRVHQHRPELPASLDSLVDRMLASDRDHRPRDGSDAAREIARVAADLATNRVGNARALSSVSTRERRVVSILLAEPPGAVLPSGVETIESDAAEPNDDVLDNARALVQRTHGSLAVLPAGRVLASWVSVGGGAEPPLRAARCALDLRARQPDARIIVVTGTSETDGTRPVGPLIERGLALLGEARPTSGTPSRLLIDGTTAALLAERFPLASEGSQHWLAEDPSSGRRARSATPSPFVGRQKELRWLLDTLDESVSDGGTRAVFVTGASGAGKSRLCFEFARRARRKALVLAAHGDPVGAGAALSLPRQWLCAASGVVHDAPLRTVRNALLRHLATLGIAPGDLTAGFLLELAGAHQSEGEGVLLSARNDPRIMSERLRDAFETWLRALCRRGPTVLVCEDVQWSDAASARLVAIALRRLERESLMVAVFGRPDVHGATLSVWSALEAQHLELPAMPRRAAERMASQCLGAGAPAHVVMRIVDRAAGNPFVLEQLARHVRDAGAGREANLPDSVLGVLQVRLDRLDPEERRVLRAASVFGGEFTTGGVAELLGVGDEGHAALAEQVRRLSADALLESDDQADERDDAPWRFRHELLREAAYAQLPDDERSAAHRSAARWLTTRGGVDTLAIAEHHERGGESALAVPWLVTAAHAALDAGDHDAVDSLAQRARRAGASGPLLGEVFILQAQADGLRKQWRHALQHAVAGCALVAAGSPAWFVGAGGAVFAGAIVGDMSDAPGLVAAMRAQPLEPPASGPRVWGLFLAATGLLVFGLREEAQEFVDIAQRVVAADPRPDPAAVGWMHATSAWLAVFATTDLEMARRDALAARKCMDAAGGSFGRAFTMGIHGLVLLERGEIETAVQTLRAAVALSGSFDASVGIVSNWLARALEAAGLPDEAVAVIDPIVVGASESLTARNAHGRRASAQLRRGRVDEAVREASAPGMETESAARGVLARAALARGDAEEALAQAEAAIALDLRQPYAPLDHSIALLTRAEALWTLDRRDDARSAIASARDRLLLVASRLDPTSRQTYLRAVDVHARTCALAGAWGDAPT